MSAARRVKLLGIQAGRGAPVPGAEDGPHVMRECGLVGRLTACGNRVEDLGDIPGVYETRFVHDAGASVHNLNSVVQVNRHTHACVLGTRRKAPKAFLLIIGGDHSLAIGALAGLSDACERLGLLWVDAHADFNTPATSPSGNIHGMSLAVACGRGHRDLRGICDFDPMVLDEDVYLLGAREIDAGERDSLAASRVNWLSTAEWRSRGITATALSACEALARRCDHVHLSFDIDVLDPPHVPGTGTPVAGGLTAEEARDLLAALGAQGVIASAEFVEYNPQLDAERRTCSLAIELISALLCP